MSTRSNSSRERILSTAEAIILQRGYAGTTIEDILENAAITKGGFFYHFDSKVELARALVERALAKDMEQFSALGARADSLSEDPLQRLLIFLNLLTEMVAGMTETHPGCLVTAFVYETQLLDDDIRRQLEAGILDWRDMIVDRLAAISEKYPSKVDTSPEVLADMFTSTLEGGIILARARDSNQPLIDQVLAYRTHVRLIFGDVS